MHDCKAQGKYGEFLFLCSRCGGCYVCRHKAVYLDEADKWVWKCKNGKLRPVIIDGRL